MRALTCFLELYLGGCWRVAGEVHASAPERGVASKASFEYDFEYLDAMESSFGARDIRAVSCRYPIGYDILEEDGWPAFLLDIMPSGAARRYWEDTLQLPNTNISDWPILVHGTSNPPGNLRVRDSVPFEVEPAHPGFLRSEVIERAEHFVEYARAAGAPVAGSTGAGGDSPKFLLREGRNGRWHADGVLPDAETRRCWLVKFPRTRDVSDRLILEAEAGYHAVAKKVGVRTGGDVTWEGDCLFAPRFDRLANDGVVERFGLESLYSLLGVAEFGAAVRKERLAAAMARFVTEPQEELREFLLRDVLDVAMGNTDNHGRNTSVLKTEDGRIELSPLYDFAPMMLDRRGIARVCRWADNSEYPEWERVAESLERFLDVGTTKRWLRGLAAKVDELPVLMRDLGVPLVVIDRCEERIRHTSEALRKVR